MPLGMNYHIDRSVRQLPQAQLTGVTASPSNTPRAPDGRSDSESATITRSEAIRAGRGGARGGRIERHEGTSA